MSNTLYDITKRLLHHTHVPHNNYLYTDEETYGEFITSIMNMLEKPLARGEEFCLDDVMDFKNYSPDWYFDAVNGTRKPIRKSVNENTTYGHAQMIRLTQQLIVVKIVVSNDYPVFFIVDERGSYLPILYGKKVVLEAMATDLDLAFAFADPDNDTDIETKEEGLEFIQHFHPFFVTGTNFWKEMDSVDKKFNKFRKAISRDQTAHLRDLAYHARYDSYITL